MKACPMIRTPSMKYLPHLWTLSISHQDSDSDGAGSTAVWILASRREALYMRLMTGAFTFQETVEVTATSSK